jgi:UDP-N-acetylglucosamine--N-acetylmuramyl-(pentapeptide) pyrophosphoryl-undecaprenol N-acetylglucosamine transferase
LGIVEPTRKLDKRNNPINPISQRVVRVTEMQSQSGREKSACRIIITGGGTGGHLFPGISIAQGFKKRNAQNQVLFVSRGNDFEKAALEAVGMPLACIPVEGIKARRRWQQMRAMLKLPLSVVKSVWIVWRYKPHIVIGVGSYAAGPVVLAAWLLRKPIALHEQNQLPGITNRILSRFAERIFVSFESSAERFADPHKVRFSGNPVRQELLAAAANAAKRLGDRFTVLILGGSQGAHSINEAVVDMLAHLEEKERYHFDHQTGKTDEQKVRQAYRSHQVSATVLPFFNDMADRYAVADLILCRAGATTVAEVTAIGKSVIFIPFPFAADNHQVVNARSLARAGAAEMIEQKDLSGRRLAEKISFYRSHPERLRAMAENAANFGKRDAAEFIVDECYELIEARSQ